MKWRERKILWLLESTVYFRWGSDVSFMLGWMKEGWNSAFVLRAMDGNEDSSFLWIRDETRRVRV